MSAIPDSVPVSSKALWIGRIVSGLVVLGLLSSAGMKLTGGDEIVAEFQRLGYPKHLIIVIAVLEVACTILYAIPQTSVLGAILLTGYLGGATATHVRIGDGSWFAPVIGGVLAWLGLLFRDPRLRPLLPLRR